MAEDNHIVTSEAVVMRNMEGFVPSSGAHNININPRLRPVMYPVNPNMGWYAHHGIPVTSGGTVENPNFVYQVGGGGVIGDRVGGGVSENPNFAYRVGGAISDSPNLGYRVGHGIGENPNYVGGGIAENPSFVNQVGGGFGASPTYDGRSNMSDQARSGGGFGGSASYDSRSNVSDQASDQGVDDQSSIEKVKLLCSFGGKILRRPNDGVLRYVGGHTRIISLRRNVSFQELVHKMIDVYGKPVVIKYQLPDGELDSLVSVSCTEDLDNMMDEYEKLVESSSHGSAKLRVFLFSASELDSSVLLQFSDLLDSGQRYIDAVNWISDGVGDGITRKVSIGSDGSMPNSDGPAGGSEGVDSTSYGQGDGYGISSPSTVSPRVASHDAPANLMYVSPNPVVYAPPMPVGPPTVFPSTPQTLPPLQSEPEFKRLVPSVVQPQVPLGYDLQKSSGMDFRPVTAYMPAYVDPHHHISSQVGLLNPQGVGTAGPIYRYAEPPPLVRDNVGVAHQQFIPAVPMSVASSDTHVGMKMNVAQQVIQQPQNLVDPYIGESAFRARVVQFPVEQNCPVYQTPCPPQPPTAPLQSGGGCGLMLPAQHVVLGDGRLTHQPGVLPEKLSNFEDCFMCQKALPHAHSDTVVKDPRYCSSTTASDANVVFHSAPLEDNLGTHPMSRVVVSGALGEAEYQGSRTQPRYIIQRDDSTSEAGMTGFSQDLEVEPEKDRILRIFGNPDNPGMLFSQGVMGKAVDVKSPYVRDIPHSEDALQQSPEPQLYQVQQKPLVNLPGGSDFPPLDGTSVQNIKPVVLESSKEYSGKNSDPFVKENTSKSCIHDHLTSIEGGVEGAHVSSLEQCSSPIHKHEKEDFPVSQPQIPEQETYPSSDFTNPKIIQDRNHIMPIGVMPTSSSEVAHFISSHPVDSNQITKPVMLGVSGPYLHCMGTQHRTCEELLQGVPDLSAIISDNTHMKDEASGFQSINASNTSSGNTLSPYGGIFGDKWEHSTSNSLFSNHDPWTLRHGQSFLPPKTNAAANDKVFIIKEQEVLHESSGHLNQCSNSEHLQSDKDVADEYSKQELKVAEEAGHKPSGHLNKESNPEDDHSNKDVADEYFRQELKSVAEGVADMALRSPMPNESSVHEVNESSPKVSHGRALDSGVEVHMMPKVEDVKAKLLDKESSGLPLSEGIGRLQIIKNCDLEELRELGSGTFGTVYHGKWRGSDVAIKRFSDRCFSGKPSERSRMIDDFWNEAIKLADLHHPNVVAFYGVVLDGPGDSVATVTEFMVNGSLRQALQRTLDKRKRLLIAMDVAFGMEYLHGKRIVHFDLKSDNLLVNLRDPHRPICKVGDLGLSKVKCHTLISGGVRGTLPWMAPELLNGSSSLVSEKVDVFSFGIVMWELLTGEEPYADLHYGIIIGGIVSNSLRPTVPESCDPMWKSLMERCWSSEPSERPSFTEIADQLRSMAASLPPKGQTPQ